MDNELRESVEKMEMRERAYYRKILTYFWGTTVFFAIVGVVIKEKWNADHGTLVLGFVGVYLGVIWTLIAAREGTMGSIEIMKVLLIRMEHLEKEIQKSRGEK